MKRNPDIRLVIESVMQFCIQLLAMDALLPIDTDEVVAKLPALARPVLVDSLALVLE